MDILLKKNGATARVTTIGGELRAYTTPSGRSCLWSGDEAVWSGVSPNLFPIIGFLKDGKVSIEGNEFSIPKHGLARKAEFSVVKQTEDSCTLSFRSNRETMDCYPFAFDFQVTHMLVENGFVTTYTVENQSERTMPFTLGGHPAFACPTSPDEDFEDYIVCFDEPEDGMTLLPSAKGLIDGEQRVKLLSDGTVLPLRYADFDKKDTLLFAGLKSRGVELRHKTSGRGIRFVFPKFTSLALWSKPNAHAPYLCMEPWIGLPAFENEKGSFETKPYHVDLAAHEVFSAWYGMETLGD